MATGVAIRDAATIILVRRDGTRPRLLMGQRGAGAVFMPNKFVFPGGGVDPGDLSLASHGGGTLDDALRLAAIRELWEETGLRFGSVDENAPPAQPPDGWAGFFADALRPRPESLRLIFRAVTPPSRPRRFDARFYLAAAEGIHDPLDDFSAASGELLFLRWIELAAARELELPFITEVVLAEVAARLADPKAEHPIPFFDHTEQGSHFELLPP